MEISTDGGSNYLTTGYRSAVWMVNAEGFATDVDGATTYFSLSAIDTGTGFGLSNTASLGGFTGEITLYDNSVTSGYTRMNATATSSGQGSGYNILIQGWGHSTNTAAVNAVRFKMGSGNITSGVIRMYGLRAS